MQKKIISKAIDPMWAQFDTEGNGYITKGQCGELALLGMEKAGFGKYFREDIFMKIYDKMEETFMAEDEEEKKGKGGIEEA